MAIFILPLAEIFFPKLKFVASSSPFRSIPFKCMMCIRFGLLLNQITRTVGFFTIIAEVKPDQRINRMERNQEEDKTKPGEEKKKLLVWIKRHSLSFYFIFQISLYFCIALIFPPYHLHRWTVNKSLSTQSLSLSLRPPVYIECRASPHKLRNLQHEILYSGSFKRTFSDGI